MREHGPLQSIDYENDFWPAFLERNVFYGLTPIPVNASYGSPLNKFFNEHEFRILLRRIEHLGIGVLGMHTLGNGRCGIDLYEWRNYEMKNQVWIPWAFQRLKERVGGSEKENELIYMAELHIFDDQLEKN